MVNWFEFMVNWLVAKRRLLAEFAADLSQANPQVFPWQSLRLAYFLVAQFALVPVKLAVFFVELPIHWKYQPTEAFTLLARRSPRLEFLESYTTYTRRLRTSVAIVLLGIVAIGAQLSFFAYSVWTVVRPTTVNAFSTSVDLNPTWDDSAYQDNLWLESNPCIVEDTLYNMEGSNNTSMTLGRTTNNPLDCDIISNYHTFLYRPGMKFSLSGIPNQATITGANLIVNVSNSTTQGISVVHPTSDDIDSMNFSEGAVFEAIGDGSVYATIAAWSSTGSKNVALSGSAVSDIQSRLSGSDVITIAIKTSEDTNNFGVIDSVNHSTPANRPILRVTYTLPPQAPTNTNHSAITTSSVTWTWTDNGTAETRYDVHSAAHAPVTGCTNLAANTQSCTETGLTANTQYTRHPNITDAQGNTDGPSASAYTAIEAISSVGPVTSTDTTMTAAASAVTNLGTGLSAVYYDDITSGQNSGWITTVSWTESGLQPNSIYQVRAKSRNADGIETAFSGTGSMYTLASAPSVTPNRALSTWFTSGTFSFTNNLTWGTGGVQYYGFAWDTQPTWNLVNPQIWSDQVSHCPFDGCTVTNPTLSLPASVDGSWYLHLQSYDQTDSPLDTINVGPFYFDATVPTTPATINDGTGADATTTTSLTTLSANWTASTDATSGISKYQYAVGTTAGGTNVLAYTDNGASTAVTNSGLSLVDGTFYYLSVRAVDVAGNIGGVRTSNGIRVDASGPSFSAITPVATPTSFTVTWTSSEASTDQVEYGLTTSYGFTTTLEQVANTSHTATVSGLAGNSVFHFRIKGIDGLGNVGYSPDQQVSTSSTPMTLISNVQTTVNSGTLVVVTWTTNEPATSKVRYGATTAYGFEVSDATLVTSHSITLNGLTAGATYHYEVISVGSTTDQDADATFTTTTVTATPAPTPITTPSSIVTPAITNINEGELIADPTPVVSGTGPLHSGIFIVVDRVLVRTVPVDNEGKFLVDLLTPLSQGPHQILVRAKLGPGLVSDESQPIHFTIVEPAAGTTITSRTIHDGEAPSVTFGLVAPGNSVVKVFLDAEEVQSIATPDVHPSAYGFFTTVTPPSTLSAGRHTISFITYYRGIRPSLPTGYTFFTKTVSADSASTPQLQYNTTTSYLVTAGDSLWSIAQHFLGDGNRWTEIQQSNIALHSSLSTSPQTIQADWTLIIPASVTP